MPVVRVQLPQHVRLVSVGFVLPACQARASILEKAPGIAAVMSDWGESLDVYVWLAGSGESVDTVIYGSRRMNFP